MSVKIRWFKHTWSTQKTQLIGKKVICATFLDPFRNGKSIFDQMTFYIQSPCLVNNHSAYVHQYYLLFGCLHITTLLVNFKTLRQQKKFEEERDMGSFKRN